jgi:hypothetical protein
MTYLLRIGEKLLLGLYCASEGLQGGICAVLKIPGSLRGKLGNEL